jgi:TRAP-type C4-dicarboxylate transport system permease small subunit
VKKNPFSWILHHLPELIAGLALTSAITITVVNATCRYALGFTYAGSDELVVLGFGWTIFPGCAAAFRLKMHMGIDALVNFFPANFRRILDFCIKIVILILNAYLTYLGFYLATHAWDKIMSATQIPYFYLDMALVAGFAFMTWYSLCFVYEDIVTFINRSRDVETEKGVELT